MEFRLPLSSSLKENSRCKDHLKFEIFGLSQIVPFGVGTRKSVYIIGSTCSNLFFFVFLPDLGPLSTRGSSSDIYSQYLSELLTLTQHQDLLNQRPLNVH
ncbi:hypothetical protein K1719_016335 [Acacia pycnantha]|nr:hypothetical protein K1719_016335 [Acacia pycnantha]